MKTPSPKHENLDSKVGSFLVAMDAALANDALVNAENLADFEIWLDSELDALLATHRNWETTDANRNYFSR